jgi:uncharacterized protein YjiS (DUF1127 family)
MSILALPTSRRAADAVAQSGEGLGDSSDWLARCQRTVACWIARSQQRRALREIAEHNDIHLLKDIGISQQDAFREADKPFWRA